MDEHTKSIHYLLMADHFMVQKALLSQIKDTELTMGQPKVLDYLKDHDGACQKDIAAGCHIEPASITAVLSGMENKGYIQRSTKSGDRRSLYVYLTDKGREYVEMLNKKFDLVESGTEGIYRGRDGRIAVISCKGVRQYEGQRKRQQKRGT